MKLTHLSLVITSDIQYNISSCQDLDKTMYEQLVMNFPVHHEITPIHKHICLSLECLIHNPIQVLEAYLIHGQYTTLGLTGVFHF